MREHTPEPVAVHTATPGRVACARHWRTRPETQPARTGPQHRTGGATPPHRPANRDSPIFPEQESWT